MAGGGIKIVDSGWAPSITQILPGEGPNAPTGVKIGVLSADASKLRKHATNGQVAAIHEFGLGVPQRSFLGKWADLNGQRSGKVFVRIAKATQSDLELTLTRFGLWVEGQIKQRIANRIDPENAPSTIARKGSDVPLIDTGQLRSSITHALVRRGK